MRQEVRYFFVTKLSNENIIGVSEQICNSKESEVFCLYRDEHKMGLGGGKV